MDSDYYTQSQGQNSSQFPSMRAGTIKSIQMKNFMCHDNLEVKLNPKINFVIGKNGSGKSAIQTAIAIGLGGKAASTNRGSSIKGLIKNDKNTASIKIVVCNEGPMAYKPSEYGEAITIERAFSKASTAGYKIKDKIGKVITTEKKELDKIVAHLNIQVQNPLCILHQDVARTFLNTCDSKSLFEFFLRASRFDDISKIYNIISSRLHSVSTNIDHKFQVVKEVFQDVIEMEKKLKILKEAKQKEKLKEKLENELIWAQVQEFSVEIEKLTNKATIEKQAKQDIEWKIKEIEDNCLQKKIEQLQLALTDKENQVQDAKDKIKPARSRYYEVKEKLSQCQAEVTEAELRVRTAEVKCQSASDEVERFTRNLPEEKLRMEKIKVEISEYEKQIESYRAAETSFGRDKRQLQDTVDNITQNLEQFKTKHNELTIQKRKRQDQIRGMQRSSNNLTVYGNTMVRFTDEINKAFSQGKFKQKPVGPLGMHIKVRDSSWAGAVEGFLGKGLLYSFCVDNIQDREALTRIRNSVYTRQDGAPPTIIQSKFFPSVHSTTANETGNRQYKNLLKMLDIDHPVVANCLIDQLEIETVLLIPTNDEAYQILDKEQTVPKKCKKAFTKSGDEFYPAPDYKSYSSMRPNMNPTFLQADKKDVIKELKNQELQLTAEISVLEEQINDLRGRKNGALASIKNVSNEHNKLKNNIYAMEQKCNELRETLAEDNERNTAYFVEELNELKIQVNAEKQKYKDLVQQHNTLQEKMKEATEEYQQLQSMIAESDRDKAPLQAEIQNLTSAIRQASVRADMLRQSLADREEKLTSLQNDIEELTEQKEQTTVNASQMCDTVETDRPPEEIKQELKRIVEYLKRIQEENMGTLEQLEENYSDRKGTFDTVVKDLEAVRKLIVKTAAVLKQRKNKENDLRLHLSGSAKINFQMFLTERNFDGKLEFDLEAGTLEIKVKPMNDKSGVNLRKLDIASLSGGEKSFSTVCFILALWQEVDVPFHFLDEFDVFMDGVNRRIVMDLLLTCAKHMNQQFVFLTPLGAAGVAESESITILSLEAPRQ